MAMTKKEREHLESLERQLREARALRFTEDVPPDVEPPEKCSLPLSRGFLFNSYNRSITKACSSSIHHCGYDDLKTTTQGSRRLFSTELRACKAMRRELELQFAKELAEIDAKIEELTKEQSE